jgi:C-terminal processing protease CtpA/Prc
MLEGRIAMLAVPAFGGGPTAASAYTEAGRGVLKGLEARGPCGWIVDLRENTGGDMWPMLSAVAPLLGTPPFGAFLDRDGRKTQVWTLEGDRVVSQRIGVRADATPRPALDGRLGAAPVAVLVSARTGSSGEFTAIGFAGRPNTALFGSGTAGLVTVNSSIPLPDGARLAISTGWAEDRTGRAYKARIDPGATSSQAALDQAISWLRTRRCPA